MMKIVRKMTRRRWAMVASVVAISTTLFSVTILDSPMLLYPATPSLPKSIYLRIFSAPEPGKIASFPMPKAAQDYLDEIGQSVSGAVNFMKLIAAGPGDHVCNRPVQGLVINGQWRAQIALRDSEGHPLPHWNECRILSGNEFFMFSNHLSNSFDSRYFGPIEETEIAGVYRRTF